MVHKDSLSVRCKVFNVFICLASELVAGESEKRLTALSVFNHLRLEMKQVTAQNLTKLPKL